MRKLLNPNNANGEFFWALVVLGQFAILSTTDSRQRLGLSFKEQLGEFGKGKVPFEDMVERLMRDTVKADESKLPRICSLDWEFNLSSIFVEVDTPHVNITCYIYVHPWKSLSSIILLTISSDVQGPYGTRSTAALAVKASGEVCFYEIYLDKDTWKEKTVNYHIQRLKS